MRNSRTEEIRHQNPESGAPVLHGSSGSLYVDRGPYRPSDEERVSRLIADYVGKFRVDAPHSHTALAVLLQQALPLQRNCRTSEEVMAMAARGVNAILVEQLHLDALISADADAIQRGAAIEFLKVLEQNFYAHSIASVLRMRLEGAAGDIGILEQPVLALEERK